MYSPLTLWAEPRVAALYPKAAGMMPGYVSGQPLGNPRRSGILVPLEPNKQRDRAGLGFVGYLPSTNSSAARTQQGPLPYDRQWDPNCYSSFKAVYCPVSNSYLYPGDDRYPDADPDSGSVVQKSSSSCVAHVSNAMVKPAVLVEPTSGQSLLIYDRSDDDNAMMSEPAQHVESFEADSQQNESVSDATGQGNVDHNQESVQPVGETSLDQLFLVGDTRKDVAIVLEPAPQTDESEAESQRNGSNLDVGCSETRRPNDHLLVIDDQNNPENFTEVEVDASAEGNDNQEPAVVVEPSLDQSRSFRVGEEDVALVSEEVVKESESQNNESTSDVGCIELTTDQQSTNDDKNNETLSEVEVLVACAQGNVDHKTESVAAVESAGIHQVKTDQNQESVEPALDKPGEVVEQSRFKSHFEQFGASHVSNERNGKCVHQPSPETTFAPAMDAKRATRNTW